MIVFIILFASLLQIAVWCAWRAVTSSRTPQGAVGWVVFLLAAPYVAVLAYLFCHHRYRGYELRLSSERVVAATRGNPPPRRQKSCLWWIPRHLRLRNCQQCAVITWHR